jgi:hypothetical protein
VIEEIVSTFEDGPIVIIQSKLQKEKILKKMSRTSGTSDTTPKGLTFMPPESQKERKKMGSGKIFSKNHKPADLRSSLNPKQETQAQTRHN